MGMFLNSKAPFQEYEKRRKKKYFVDKTALLEEILPLCELEEPYLCFTRPRRFGKSVMAYMMVAFFEKGVNAKPIFDGLHISHSEYYTKYLNQYHVIFIDFSRTPRKCTTYEQYIDRIEDGINEDLMKVYPDMDIDINDSVPDVLLRITEETQDKFIFVMDEWDAVFHMDFISEENRKQYLLFLKNLLKNQSYVECAYMTGVLPISKYSSGSELNMFVEYDMTTTNRFSEYFGFLNCEVDALFERYKKENKNPTIKRDDLRIWYDGYYTVSGEKIYNPRSIVCALADNQIRSYWTSSGPYDEIFYYVKHNIKEIRDDLVLMISGEGIRTRIEEYAAASMELKSKSEIYSAMVVYGLLTYKDGRVYIPNREIMEQFNRLLLEKESLGYVYRLARESEKMLRATLQKDTKTMAEILEFAHDTESPVLSYNSEIELSSVVNLVYLAARDAYRIEREDKAGKGYVDFIFYPEQKEDDAIILELKVNDTPEHAIAQIKEKKYQLRFLGKLGEKPKYTGKILAVGISYDKESKKHFCKVEELK